MNSLAQTTSSATELERARAVIASELNARANETEGLADAALDVDTYKLSSDTQSMNALNRITPADVQRVASRLFKDAPVATMVVGDAEELKTAFGSNVEVRGATAELKNPSSPPVSPPKP
jgi:predicted Zn-dependent peptidase